MSKMSKAIREALRSLNTEADRFAALVKSTELILGGNVSLRMLSDGRIQLEGTDGRARIIFGHDHALAFRDWVNEFVADDE